MWEYKHPEAPCFTTQCKPKPRSFFLKDKSKQKIEQFGDVFIGSK